MAKKDVIEAEGVVVEAQPNAMFIVELEQNQDKLYQNHSRGQSQGGTFTV